MFERFTKDARSAVVAAQEQAARLGHTQIGAEHLLLAVLADAPSTGARALVALGADHDAVAAQVPGRWEQDEAALRALGIDLADVRRRVEASFGEGAFHAAARRGSNRARHIPFTRAAKKALENALREAIVLGHRRIGTEHIALGLLADPHGVVRQLLAATGVVPSQQEARHTVLLVLADAA